MVTKRARLVDIPAGDRDSAMIGVAAMLFYTTLAPNLAKRGSSFGPFESLEQRLALRSGEVFRSR